MTGSTSQSSIYHQLCSKFGTTVVLAAFCVLIGGQYQAGAWLPFYSDNFDDSNDTLPAPAWNHYDPIKAGFPAYSGNTFNFPGDPYGGNNYELYAPPSPNPAGLGGARTMAYRPEVYTNFNITADLMPGWAGGGGGNGTNVQVMGLAARLNNITTAPGAGQLNGYMFAYMNCDQSAPSAFTHNVLIIVRLDHENYADIPGSGNGPAGTCYLRNTLNLDNSLAYRFQFIGKGTHLEGRVYALTDTNTPLAVLDANTAGDSVRWTNGLCGIIGGNVNDGAGHAYAGSVDMIWDNYTASYHSPYEIRDDFNRGNDGAQNYPPWSGPAWLEYDGLGSVSLAPPATFSFPNLGGGNHGYEISAPPGPPAGYEAYGYARAGAIMTNVTYSDFYVAADVSNWNASQDIVVGLVARGQNVYIGGINAYIWTWEADGSPATYPLWISKLSSEVGSGVDSASYLYQFQTGRTYRMTFTGRGTQLTGRVTDLTTGSTNIVITTTDATYNEGYVGLLIATSQSAAPTDPHLINPYATFDNFYADTAEPRLGFSTDGSGKAVLKWPATLASIWTLQTGSSVAPSASWTEISGDAAKAIYFDSTTGLNTYTNSATMSAGPNTYFRLKRLDPLAYP